MSKICVVCGADCDGKPRVKDAKGHYYCRGCHDELAAKASRAKDDLIDLTAPAAPPRIAVDADTSSELPDIAGLAVMAAAAPTAIPASLACPACHAELTPGAILCVNCGHDLRSGKARKTKVTSMPSLPGAAPQRVKVSSGGGALDVIVGPWTVSLGTPIRIAIAFALMAIPSLAGYLATRDLQAPTSGSSFYQAGRAVGGILGVGFWSTLGALLYYLLGSWWLKVRVNAAGGDVDFGAASSAYFVSALPAIPVAAVVLLTSLSSVSPDANPIEVLTAAVSRDLAVRIALAVGCIWLFFIARRNFGVRTVAAAMVIVVVPVIWYTAVTIGFSKLIESVKSLQEDAPIFAPSQVNVPERTFEGNVGFAVSFVYPGTWKVESKTHQKVAAAIGSSMLVVQSPDRAELRLVLVDQEVDVAGILDGTVQMLESQGASVTVLGNITELGGLIGTGREYRVLRAGRGFQLVHFLAEPGDRLSRPVWIETARLEADSAARRSFLDILRTLRTTSAAP